MVIAGNKELLDKERDGWSLDGVLLRRELWGENEEIKNVCI